MTYGAPFFTVEQSIRRTIVGGLTFDLGHGTRSHGALALTETTYTDDTIRASDMGYIAPAQFGVPDLPYPPRVQEAFAVDAVVNLDPAASAVSASWGSIVLANNDHKYDSYVTGGWVADGQTTTIHYGLKTREEFPGFATTNSTGGTWLERDRRAGTRAAVHRARGLHERDHAQPVRDELDSELGLRRRSCRRARLRRCRADELDYWRGWPHD